MADDSERLETAAAMLAQACGCQPSVAAQIVGLIALGTLSKLGTFEPIQPEKPEPLTFSKDFDEAIIAARSILGLLHYRGLVDSDMNREDVAKALTKITPFSAEAEQRMEFRRHISQNVDQDIAWP